MTRTVLLMIGALAAIVVVMTFFPSHSRNSLLSPAIAQHTSDDHNHKDHDHAKGDPMLAVYVYNKDGKLIGPVQSPRVELSDAQWKKKLGEDQFRVLRSKGTEQPFCGTLLDNKKEGVYTCAGCGLPLFSSDSKFDSGTGWPSFFQPIAKENVLAERDETHGMVRIEIMCARCEGHLGHVFEDGPKPTGLRFCMNSESLNFTDNTELAKLADPAAEKAPAKQEAEKPAKPEAALPANTKQAIVAGGCFWCTEAAYEQLKGVINVEAGYIGGSPDTANYQAVCNGDTGHAEAIRITYDPARISYDKLLDIFFDAHDPTTLNRQGNDVGTQYRSAIFFASDEEKQAAEKKIAALTAAKKFKSPIVTKLEKADKFYRAEGYHQDYARLNPNNPYILGHSEPTVCKIRELHKELIEENLVEAKK